MEACGAATLSTRALERWEVPTSVLEYPWEVPTREAGAGQILQFMVETSSSQSHGAIDRFWLSGAGVVGGFSSLKNISTMTAGNFQVKFFWTAKKLLNC